MYGQNLSMLGLLEEAKRFILGKTYHLGYKVHLAVYSAPELPRIVWVESTAKWNRKK